MATCMRLDAIQALLQPPLNHPPRRLRPLWRQRRSSCLAAAQLHPVQDHRHVGGGASAAAQAQRFSAQGSPHAVRPHGAALSLPTCSCSQCLSPYSGLLMTQ
jgi:hypothetical protein